MGLAESFKKWQARRAIERNNIALIERWNNTVRAAVEAGAKQEVLRDQKDPTSVVVALDDVPERLAADLERVGFYRLGPGSKVFMCTDPRKPRAVGPMGATKAGSTPMAVPGTPRPPGMRPFITNTKTGERRPLGTPPGSGRRR